MLRYEVGDASAPPRGSRAIIAHVCNDLGRWGAGFTRAISHRWPTVEHVYRTDLRLGHVTFLRVIDFAVHYPCLVVANMVAQRGVGRGVRRIDDTALATCLRHVQELALRERRPVYMPRIGCGLAGATWSEIEPIVQRHLIDALPSTIDVVVRDLPA